MSSSTVEAAEQSGHPFDFYRISKKLAEQATWGWVEKNKPHFSVSVMVAYVCPMEFSGASNILNF
jgi:hypothetical protein